MTGRIDESTEVFYTLYYVSFRSSFSPHAMNTTPLELLYSPTSPYVRKVLLLVHEGGIAAHISLRSNSPWDEGNPVIQTTPTGTIPALLIHDEPSLPLLSDSNTICAYLIDRFCLTHLLPAASKYTIWQQVTVANKIMEMVVQRFLERNKRDEDKRSEFFLARWQLALDTSIAYLEKNGEALMRFCTLASLATASALSYVALRYSDYDWQKSAPKLAEWHAQFKQRGSMQMTEVPQS